MEKKIHKNAKQLKKAFEDSKVSISDFAEWAEITRPAVYTLLKKSKPFNMSERMLVSYYFGTEYFDMSDDFFSDRERGLIQQNDASDKVVVLTGEGFSNKLTDNPLRSIIDVIKNNSTDSEKDQISILDKTWNILKYESKNNSLQLIRKLSQYLNLARTLIEDSFLRKEVYGNILSHEAIYASNFFETAIMKCYNVLVESYGPNRLLPVTSWPNYLNQWISLNGGRLHLFNASLDCLLSTAMKSDPQVNLYTNFNEEGNFTKNWYLNRDLPNENSNSDLYLSHLYGCVSWSIENSKLLDKGPYTIKTNHVNSLGIKLKHMSNFNSYSFFSESMELFKETLTKCKVLVICGYDLEEEEVLNSIHKALSLRRKNPFQIVLADSQLSSHRKERLVSGIDLDNAFDQIFTEIPLAIHPYSEGRTEHLLEKTTNHLKEII